MKTAGKEMYRMLHEASGCRTPYFHVPVRLAYRLAAHMEKKAKKTGEKPMMTSFSVYNLDRNNTFDYSKAERELGYRTRPCEETLRDKAQWLAAEGFPDNGNRESQARMRERTYNRGDREYGKYYKSENNRNKNRNDRKINIYNIILQIILDLCDLRSSRILHRNNMVLDRFSGVFQQDGVTGGPLFKNRPALRKKIM
mgnify:FL=1